MTWQRFGGDPGGFLEGSDARLELSVSGSWSGDWSRNVGAY
jgi:hypothetical protein